MTRHEEYKEMAAIRALGALDSAEAREFEAHLATCDECRTELEAWQDVAAEVAYAAPAVEPPVELRSRILESIRAESKEQNTAQAVKDLKKDAASPRVEASSGKANVTPFAKPARPAPRVFPKIFAIAASVAFVALMISLLLLWNRYHAMRNEMARLADRFDQSQAELARERENSTRAGDLKDLISAPDAHLANLAGTEMAANARGHLVMDRKTGRSMLMADGLPPAPEGKAYQLWFIAEGKPPMPGQLFTPDAKGHTEMRAEVPAEARNANTFAVTLEPQGGATAPTGPKYLLSAS